ncbi:MAG: hypothetical protein RJB13_1749 [Pseudomonadota bacterium]
MKLSSTGKAFSTLILGWTILTTSCQKREFNVTSKSEEKVEYSAEAKKFFTEYEKKVKPGFKFNWDEITAAQEKLDEKIASLPASLAIEDQPLTKLPENIPVEFRPALQVLLDSQRGQGVSKIRRRIVLDSLVNQIAKIKNAGQANRCSLDPAKNDVQAEVMNDLLKEFVLYVYKKTPEPLPDAFLTAVPFYGHLVEKETPFLDVAFAPGGSMAHKAAHSVNVHVMDFFDIWLACSEKGSPCAAVNLKKLTVYIGLQGIVEAMPQLKKNIENLKKELRGNLSNVEASTKRNELEASEADLARANKMLSANRISALNWSQTEFQNGTALWDVFFDFQNLSDEAFKDYLKIRAERKLKQDEYLALSFRTVSNPFYMGKPEVLKALFPCSGWN